MQSTNRKPDAKNDISLRPLTQADIAELAELAGYIWRVTYPDTLTSEEIEGAIARGYSAEKLSQALEPPSALYGAYKDGAMVGFTHVEMKPDASMFIHKLYVHPDVQGGGIGRKLLNEVFVKHQPPVARLNTNRRNVKAINFYFSQGFIIEKLDPHDSGVGFFADDFLLVRRL